MSEKLKQLEQIYSFVKNNIMPIYGLNNSQNMKYRYIMELESRILEEKKRINRSAKFKILLDE